MGHIGTVDSRARAGVSLLRVTARQPSLRDALDLGRLGADRAADRLGLAGVRTDLSRGARASCDRSRRTSPPCCSLSLRHDRLRRRRRSLARSSASCGTWSARATRPQPWELALLGIAQPLEGTGPAGRDRDRRRAPARRPPAGRRRRRAHAALLRHLDPAAREPAPAPRALRARAGPCRSASTPMHASATCSTVSPRTRRW